jgi:hypothetical protein
VDRLAAATIDPKTTPESDDDDQPKSVHEVLARIGSELIPAHERGRS